MSTTLSLGITHLEPAQANKEIVLNESADNFDKAIAGRFAFSAAAGGTIVLAPADSTNMMLNATGAPGAAFTVVVQATNKIWIFINGTGQSCTIKTAAGTGAVVAAGKKALIYCDGTNVNLVFSS